MIDKNDKLRPGIPELLKIADRTNSKKPLTTTIFVTTQAKTDSARKLRRKLENADPPIPSTAMQF